MGGWEPARVCLLLLAATSLGMMAGTRLWDATRSEVVFRETCAAEALYAATDYAFAWCGARGVDAVLIDGALIGAVRSGSLIPWDHDVEMQLLASDQATADRLTGALRARFGRHVASYIEIHWTATGEVTLESCGVNAQIADRPLHTLVGVVLHPFGGFGAWCRSRQGLKALPPIVPTAVRNVTLRHASRGWTASVRIPLNALALVPRNSGSVCMADHIGVRCASVFGGGEVPELHYHERWDVWLSFLIHGRERTCPR